MATSPAAGLLLLVIIQGVITRGVVAQSSIPKYPGDECSTELRDNHKCMRNSACIHTGYYDDGEPRYQCMCSEGRVLDLTLWCSDCSANNQCGANAVCQTIPDVGDRCHCNDPFVRNVTLNDGSCTTCNEGESGLDSLCDKGACVDGACVCGLHFLRDPVNNTCIHCDQPWLPDLIQCNATYANTSCWFHHDLHSFACVCPLGEALSLDGVCGECDDVTAPCPSNKKCLLGTDWKEPEIAHKYCYETCDKEDDMACNPRPSHKLCTVSKLNLGVDRSGEPINVCRCANGYEALDDDSCLSAMNRLNCFTCNDTGEVCNERQDPKSHYYETCEVGDMCWTTANWYWDFNNRTWTNITYRRDCHSNPCANPGESFCTDDRYHPGHHVCVQCCTTGLCNKRVLIPQSVINGANARRLLPRLTYPVLAYCVMAGASALIWVLFFD